jgi:hypothetical protein
VNKEREKTMQAKVIGKYADERGVVRCDHGPSSIVRNRYFYSMLLEAQDLAQDQAFHLGNSRRHTAELHGFGTVCGLRVERTQCHEQVRVKAGVAVDCLGREIRLECDVLLDLHEAIEAVLKKKRTPVVNQKEVQAVAPAQAARSMEDGCDDPLDVFVALCYREADERPVQALGGPQTCCASTCQTSRTRSGWYLEVTDTPPRVPKRIESLVDELFECERERIKEWICEWITERCWQCEPDPCGKEHHCVGLARVRVVPGGSVVDIDNCCIRPLVLPTVLLAALSQYAVERTGRE